MRKLNKTLKFTVSSGFDDTHKPTEFVRIKDQTEKMAS